MLKRRQRVFSAFLALIMLFSCLGTAIPAAAAEEGQKMVQQEEMVQPLDSPAETQENAGTYEFDYAALMERDTISEGTLREPAAGDGKYVIFFGNRPAGENWVTFDFSAQDLPAGAYRLSIKANHGTTRSNYAVYAGDALVCADYDTHTGSGDITTEVGVLTVGESGAQVTLKTHENSYMHDYLDGQYEIVLHSLQFDEISLTSELENKIGQAKAALDGATDAGKERLEAAIEAAEAVLAEEAPTAEEIYAALQSLTEAIEAKNIGWSIRVAEDSELELNVPGHADTGELVSVTWGALPEGKWLSQIRILAADGTEIDSFSGRSFTMPGQDVVLEPVLSDLASYNLEVTPIEGITVSLSAEEALSGERVAISYHVTDPTKYLDTFLVTGAVLDEDMTFCVGSEDVTVQAVLKDRVLESELVEETEDTLRITTGSYEVCISKADFRYFLTNRMTGETVADMHETAGILVNGRPVTDAELISVEGDEVILQGMLGSTKVRVVLKLGERYINFRTYIHGISAQEGPAVFIRHNGGEPAYLISNEDFSGAYELAFLEQLDGLSSTSGAGPMVGYQDMDNYINVRKVMNEAWPAANIEVLKFAGGEITKTNIGTCNQNTQLTVKVDGNKLFVYDGEELLGEYDNGAPISGKVGYRSYKSQTDLFNIKVSRTQNGATETVYDISDYDSCLAAFERAGVLFERPATGSRTYYKFQFQTAGVTNDAGLAPVYGLGDSGGYGGNANLAGRSFDNIMNNGGTVRFISTFAVFPEKRFAEVLFSPQQKMAAFTQTANMEGLTNAVSADGMYYFFGSDESELKDIYQDYKDVRNAEGYLDAEPIYDFFGVGFEGYGAMGWAVAEDTMQEYARKFLDRGYNLKWGVLGSGFWKGQRSGGTSTSNDPYQGCTTSFGLYDNGKTADGSPETAPYDIRYPNAPIFADIEKNFDQDPDNDIPYDELFPEGTFQHFFRENNLKAIFGLRVNFKAMPGDGGNFKAANDGQWVQEGLDKGYFLKNEDGTLLTTTVLFPAGNVYMLDTSNPEALAWYKEGTEYWYVNGWKEDTMATNQGTFRDHDDVPGGADYYLCYDEDANGNLVRNNVMEMVRNGAYSLHGDILRINDTGSNDPGRIITNTAAFAASGMGNVYPDIVGANFATGSIGKPGYQNFLARNAIACALMPSVSLGNLPWGADNPLEPAVLNAMNWHSTYQAYIYDAARKSWETGYPYSYNPLFLAYPDDPNVANQFDKNVSTAQWLIGESLMAAPILDNTTSSMNGNKSDIRDVYLPAGSKWMDINTGEICEGGQTLTDVKMDLMTMPVYVGNTAITVREDWMDTESTLPENENYGYRDRSVLYNDLYCDVYPISPEGAVYEFTYPYSPEKVDGYFQDSADVIQKSVITNQVSEGAWDPARIAVLASDGTQVDFTVDEVTGTISFKLEEGVNYTVTEKDTPTAPVYRPETETGEHGTVSVSPLFPRQGQTVTITPKPEEGYELESLTVTDRNGKPVEVTEQADGTWKFTQPAGKVTITAEFAPVEPITFYDVETGSWYEAAVNAMVEAGLMQGIGNNMFQPFGTVTRATMWTILARMDGVDTEGGSSWYEKAQAWAVAEGVSDGTNPEAVVTREQIAAMLYRYAGSPAAENALDFADSGDISDWAADAMAWAVAEGILTGTPGGKLNPQGTATRAEAAVMLQRILQKTDEIK